VLVLLPLLFVLRPRFDTQPTALWRADTPTRFPIVAS
jgi:hypothetical protein